MHWFETRLPLSPILKEERLWKSRECRLNQFSQQGRQQTFKFTTLGLMAKKPVLSSRRLVDLETRKLDYL